MKYTTYDTFIDYLFSEKSKANPYDKLTGWLIKSGSYEDFVPEDGESSVSIDDVQSRAVPYSEFDRSPDTYDIRPSVSNSNGLTSETDKSYQEIFNVPAKENLSECKYINAFVQKAEWNEMLRDGLEEYDGSSQGNGPRPLDSQDESYQTLKDEIPFKSKYDEAEYDAYGIQLDFLNSEAPGVIAEELLKFYGSKITTPNGCLIGVLKENRVYPIGYIDFESVKPSTRVEIKLDPSGFLQLK